MQLHRTRSWKLSRLSSAAGPCHTHVWPPIFPPWQGSQSNIQTITADPPQYFGRTMRRQKRPGAFAALPASSRPCVSIRVTAASDKSLSLAAALDLPAGSLSSGTRTLAGGPAGAATVPSLGLSRAPGRRGRAGPP
eukprot:768564-Hanusia_phi.AAC.4